jgi:tellurite methyltransferase
MKNQWNSYWSKESNRSFWLEPDKAIIELTAKLERSTIKDVLDVGCGIGRHALLLVERGYNVTALDSSAEALEVLRNRISEKGAKIKIVQGDYSQDIFPHKSFDFIIAYNVLYHGYRENVKKSIDLIYNWLRPEGLFFITCPSRRDGKYGDGEQVAPNTYRPNNSIHAGDIHYFADESDILELLKKFDIISKNIDEHNWDNDGRWQFSSYWRFLARKR